MKAKEVLRRERRKPKDTNCLGEAESSVVAKVSQGSSRLVLAKALVARDQSAVSPGGQMRKEGGW